MSDSPIVVIPARYNSSRFPGKPLALINGKSMIRYVWEAARLVKSKIDLYIATDDDRIRKHCEEFGAKVIITSESCKNGSERVFEAAQSIPTISDQSVIINLQGDTPLLPSNFIDELCEAMKANQTIRLATLAVPISGLAAKELYQAKLNGNQSNTLVTFDGNKNALYFSRSLIPNPREGVTEQSIFYKHIGIYAYRYSTLKQYVSLTESNYEKIEQLEQLRALENGIPIKVIVSDLKGKKFVSVDTPEDLKAVFS